MLQSKGDLESRLSLKLEEVHGLERVAYVGIGGAIFAGISESIEMCALNNKGAIRAVSLHARVGITHVMSRSSCPENSNNHCDKLNNKVGNVQFSRTYQRYNHFSQEISTTYISVSLPKALTCLDTFTSNEVDPSVLGPLHCLSHLSISTWLVHTSCLVSSGLPRQSRFES